MKYWMNGMLSACLASGFLFSGVQANAEETTVSDVMMMAECGGFFNAYGSMIGHESLFRSGSRLAAQVLENEDDKRSVALSFERGSEFAGTLFEAQATDEIAGYIRNCSVVVARNGEYLSHAS